MMDWIYYPQPARGSPLAVYVRRDGRLYRFSLPVWNSLITLCHRWGPRPFPAENALAAGEEPAPALVFSELRLGWRRQALAPDHWIIAIDATAWGPQEFLDWWGEYCWVGEGE